MITQKKDPPTPVVNRLEDGEDLFTFQCPDCPFTTQFIAQHPRVWSANHLCKPDSGDIKMIVWHTS